MKKTIILLLCLSLLLCGCQAAGNDTGTEPTAAPTVAPTEEPTQEPTQETTEPPTEESPGEPVPTTGDGRLLAGTIHAEMRWVGTLSQFENGYEFNSKRTLHSVADIQDWITSVRGNDLVWMDEIDYSRYDDAFFAENAIIAVSQGSWVGADYRIGIRSAVRNFDGSYRIYLRHSHNRQPEGAQPICMIFFVELKGATIPAEVKCGLSQDLSNFDNAITVKDGVCGSVSVLEETPEGEIASQIHWVGTADSWSKNIDMGAMSQPLHSVQEMETAILSCLGDVTAWKHQIDFSKYNDAFFRRNSVIVYPLVLPETSDWSIGFPRIERDMEGKITLHIGVDISGSVTSWNSDAYLFFIELYDYTEKTLVSLSVDRTDLSMGNPAICRSDRELNHTSVNSVPVDYELKVMGRLYPVTTVQDVYWDAPKVSDMLHSQQEIYAFLTKALGEGYTNKEAIDNTPYDEAFFEEHSIVVLLACDIWELMWCELTTDGIYKQEDGSYHGLITFDGSLLPEWPEGDVVVGYLIIKNVTNDADVNIKIYQDFGGMAVLYS